MELNRDLLSLKKEDRKDKIGTICFVVIILSLCVFIIFLRYCWLYCVQVEGNSMNDTLKSGDLLLVNKLAEPKVGDVVVFELNGKNYIKRIVCEGGDTIKIANGKVYVKHDGENEFVLVQYGEKGYTEAKVYPSGAEFEYYVPFGCIYALGDNRENSVDSRVFGAVPLDNVLGVVSQGVIDNRYTFWGKFYRYL